MRLVKKTNSVILFYIIVFVLSIPFWIVAAVAPSLSTIMPMHLPISAFMFVCPVVAALVVTVKQSGVKGAKKLLARVFDARRIKNPNWFAPLLLIMPVVMTLEYFILRLIGRSIPEIHITLISVLLLFAVYFIAAACEELGWTGYVIESLPKRWSALAASIFIGGLWAIWHIIPFLQTGHGITWMVWQCFVTVLLRVLIVWLYVNAGKSVFVAIVFHAMVNVSETLFPNNGSAYDPALTVLLLFAVVAMILTQRSWRIRLLKPVI